MDEGLDFIERPKGDVAESGCMLRVAGDLPFAS